MRKEAETDYENKAGREKSAAGGWGGGVYLSAVVIKACALKGGQSIRLSACTSHQAAAKNESPGPGGLLGPLRARERESEQQAASLRSL